MADFIPSSKDLFFKSAKSGDPRLGEFVSPRDPQSPSPHSEKTYIVAGYPDDEGIQINGGRPGARQAPDVIRKYFYKMTASAWSSEQPRIEDVGNLTDEISLADRHEKLKNTVARNLKVSNTVWVGLGGGHDYGYPDGAGFLQSQTESKYKPLVINFDAHLDVRPDDQGLSSGTPFYRLLQDKQLPVFDFIELGLQPQCNSRSHLEWLKSHGGLALSLEELTLNGNLTETVLEKLGSYFLQPRPTYLSVDIDAFSSAYAPGCSQSWATGLVPQDFLSLLKILKKRLDIRALGIYEVSPPLDTDDRTSKLAAQILHTLIY